MRDLEPTEPNDFRRRRPAARAAAFLDAIIVGPSMPVLAQVVLRIVAMICITLLLLANPTLAVVGVTAVVAVIALRELN